MEYDKNPLTPHLQIYKWQISSLLSITHRITGVINAIAISLICIWFLFTINNEKILFENILNSFFRKFIINQAINGIKNKELSLINNHFFVDLFIVKDPHPKNK